MQNEKCVLVLNEALPTGILANTAAILGITIGAKRPDVVGDTITDSAGRQHAGIIRFPVPVLRGTAACIRTLRGKLFSAEYSDCTVVDFTDLAQRCKTYSEFVEAMAACPEADLTYMGLALCGDKRKINRLTGNLPLLR